MGDLETIFIGLPQYVGDTWWQEHFAKKYEGVFKGSHFDISVMAIRALAEEIKKGLERATAEASEYISSTNAKNADIRKTFDICSNLAVEFSSHIDSVRLALVCNSEFDKWFV